MDTALIFILFAVGVVLVIKGGDFFVDAASWMAEVSGIPKLIVGATVVSIATTLPEMLVSVMAAAQKKVDMAVGNAVGSVTANIGLIMAIALVCMPGVIKRKDYLLKAFLMCAAAWFIMLFGFDGEVTLVYALILIVIFFVFIIENVSSVKRTMKTEGAQEKDPNLKQKKTVITNLIKFVVGTVGIVVGARLLVDNGSEMARMFGVSERIIGVTLVAVGTSLPELITTITAVVKKQSALSVGNILGANIIDMTLIMPLASFVSGKSLPLSESATKVDLPVCLLVCLVAMIPAMIRSKFSKWQGFLLLAIYAAYLVITCVAV